MELIYLLKLFIPAAPTFLLYLIILYWPNMASRLISTFCLDFLSNMIWSILFCYLKGEDFSNKFMVFICIVFLVVLFIQVHTALVFLLQVNESPINKNFHDTVKENIGCPPAVEFLKVPTESATGSATSSRETSPTIFKYGSWQDMTQVRDVVYSECLRVTTATNIRLSDSARAAILEKEEELKLRYAQKHKKIITRLSCDGVTEYFVSNTSGKRTGTLGVLRSRFGRIMYYLAIVFGYRLFFECSYYIVVKDTKIQLVKLVGTKEDGFRAHHKEIDTDAQNKFSLFIEATDEKHRIVPPKKINVN